LERPRGPLPTRVQGTDPLPGEYATTLDTGLAALGIDLPAGARDAIDGHVRLLLAWNQAINLTAIRDAVAAATLHVLDSLAAVPLLRSERVERLLDLGSGGGFPGIPLAAALPAEALLVESIGKKAVFLRTTVEAVDLPSRVEVAAERGETLAADPAHREGWPVVVARAVAALPELAELAMPLVAVGGLLVAWKREPLQEEVDAARAIVGQLGGDRPEVVDIELPGLEDHRLVVIRKRSWTPDRYPRSAADRKRTARARDRDQT
jgi:16S rRNA (guanine527-N7)-methyltransferase